MVLGVCSGAADAIDSTTENKNKSDDHDSEL